MKCPYCNGEMSPGSIKNPNAVLSWTPRGQRHRLTRWGVAKNGVQLGDYSFFFGGETDAFYCSACKKVVIDVN